MKPNCNPVSLLFVLCTAMFTSCDVVEETLINADGSGVYSLSFDISEMLKSGNFKDSNLKKMDISKDLSQYYEARKDSISRLSKAEQLNQGRLNNYHVHLIADPEVMLYKITVTYRFKELSELRDFGTFIKDQKIQELDMFFSALQSTSTTGNHPLEFNKSFITTYNNDKFSVKMTPEAMQQSLTNKNPDMKSDPKMDNIIKIKMKYNFPKVIKKINNRAAIVSADSKGYEVRANAYDLNHNPGVFDTEIAF